MESDDIKAVMEMKEELDKEHEAQPFNHANAVEESLYSFLDYRLKQLRKDIDFQDILRSYLQARLPEVDFNDIRVLLHQEQQNSNMATQSVLTPFIPRVQEADKGKGKNKQIEDQIFEESTKENLQAFNEFFQMFNELKKNKDKKDTSGIKNILAESIKED